MVGATWPSTMAPPTAVPAWALSVSDADDEVRHAVRQVVDATRSGTPLERIAILYGTRDPYARLIADVLAWSAEHPDDWTRVWQLIEDGWGRQDPCSEGALQPFNIDAKINGAYVALGHYEWTHLLVHTRYRVKSRYYRRLARNHRRHHYRNEGYWMGITSNLGDRLFGTYPKDSAGVPLSDTARTLHSSPR